MMSSIPVSSSTTLPMRNRYTRLYNFNQLPVIEEESGNTSESEFEFRNYFYSNSELKDAYQKRKTFNILLNNKLNKKFIRKGNAAGQQLDNKADKPPPSEIPTVLNINCLMNTEVKQSQQIWDTNFGKRLMNNGNGKKETQSGEELFLEAAVREEKKDAKKNEESVISMASEPSALDNEIGSEAKNEENIKVGDGKRAPRAIRSYGKGLSKTIKAKQKLKNVCTKMKKLNTVQTNSCENTGKLTSQDDQVPVDVENEESEHLKNSTHSLPLTLSTSGRNQRLISSCVRRILESSTNRFNCDSCGESFADAKELSEHTEKAPGSDRQCCPICGRLYKPAEFVGHLLTHESVDRFSCKRCRRYFSSREKYEQHAEKHHHPTSGENVSTLFPEMRKRDYVMDYLRNRCGSRFECSRCNVEFDSKENQDEHRRLHLKMDINAANLLCPDQDFL